MKQAFFLILFVATFVPLFGGIPKVVRIEQNEAPEYKVCSTRPIVLSGQRALSKRPYDVLGYALTMDWRNPLQTAAAGTPNHAYSGVNTITLLCDSANLSSITLDAAAMAIDSVFFEPGKTRLDVTPLETAKSFSVALPAPANKGDIFNISVYYTRTGQENRGFFLFPKGLFVGIGRNGDTVRTLAPLAYTMSEPTDARYWMPCNDNPYDKATFSLSLILPYSSGSEINFTPSTSIQGDAIIGQGTKSRTFSWNDTTPISTYLVCVNASYFGNYRQWYKRFSNPADSIPLYNYAWQEDIDETSEDATKYNLKNSVKRVPEMMRVFSELYVEYPFKNYGHTSVHPFSYGGMEHQSLSTVNRSWLHGLNESGFAHELMHQWTGDYVTCATWADIWLNEGGATFGEALWEEYKNGKKGYRNFLRTIKNGYLSAEQPAVWGVPFENIFNYGTTYAKSGLIYAMLRYVVGDSVFFPTMRKYLNEHAYSYAETEDMLAVFEREVPNSIVPMRTFFEQWLYKRGHPDYDVEFSSLQQADKYLTKIILKQRQIGENVPDVFVMPVILALNGAKDQRQTFRVLNDKRSQEYEFATDFPVVSAIVDEGENILCVRSASAVSVEETQPSSDLSVAPNPITGNSISVQFSVAGKDSPVIIALYNTTGEIIQTLYNAIIPAGTYTITRECNIPSGAYYIRISDDSRIFVRPLSVVR